MEPDSKQDESWYPGPDRESTSEDEVDFGGAEQTSLSLEADTLPPPEVTCSICSDIMIDPVSLHCGHTFCQLCLAQLWRSKGKLSPSSLQCPVCRLPWRNFPGVNITLRNIIEKNHSDLVASRKGQSLPEDENLLKAFNSIKEDSWRGEREHGQRLNLQIQQHQAIRVILFLCVIVAVLVVVLGALMFVGGAVWAWSGASGEYMRKPVAEWSNNDVVEWVRGLGQWTQPNITQLFIKEAITGAQLLKLDKVTLSSFGLLTEFRQETILDAIEILRQNNYNIPRNLHEFAAANRKHTFIITVLYKLWPRFTFLYAYVFCYDSVFLPLLKDRLLNVDDQDVFHEDTVDLDPSIPTNFVPSWKLSLFFFCQIVVVPHFIVLSFMWNWWPLHPWVGTAIATHLFVSMYKEGRLAVFYVFNIRTWKFSFLRASLRWVGINLLTMLGVTVLVSIAWPFTPHFICDIVFYVVIWHSAVRVLFLPVKKFCNLQVNLRHNVRLR